MNKILILVRGGNIQAIHSTDPDTEIAIIDYDNVEVGGAPVLPVIQPDRFFEPGKAHEDFTDADDPIEIEIRDHLKSIHF